MTHLEDTGQRSPVQDVVQYNTIEERSINGTQPATPAGIVNKGNIQTLDKLYIYIVDWNNVCLCCQQVYEDGQRLYGCVDEFEQASRELLAVIVNEDRQHLESSLSSVVARWKVCRRLQFYFTLFPLLNILVLYFGSSQLSF